MIRRLRMLTLGCPVCGRRRTHLVFCRWRPGPMPPILLPLLLVAPFWIGTYLVAGWVGIGVMLIVCGVTELLLFAAPPWWDRIQRRRPERVVRTYRPDEVVGELFADTRVLAERAELLRLTHCHRCGACICHEHEAIADDTWDEPRRICGPCSERAQAA